jgi:hypothetical protein
MGLTSEGDGLLSETRHRIFELSLLVLFLSPLDKFRDGAMIRKRQFHFKSLHNHLHSCVALLMDVMCHGHSRRY